MKADEKQALLNHIMAECHGYIPRFYEQRGCWYIRHPYLRAGFHFYTREDGSHLYKCVDSFDYDRKITLSKKQEDVLLNWCVEKQEAGE